LKDYRDKAAHGEGTPWFHLATRDFVHFTDYGEALARGTPDEQDLYVFTGCVYEHDGLFHIFYTGHNPHLRARGQPEQALMHATSPDLLTWTKDPANPILFADSNRFEPHDWRDPFVFWNAEAEQFWLLLAARTKQGPSNRRGCTAVAVSPDLVRWRSAEPLWSPHLYFTHECPDLFRMGDWWYLVYSTFTERHITHYRMSRSLSGPWLAPSNDAFDGRAFYAAKTASDGRRRFAFGWDPSRTDETDTGSWNWGGHLVVHEVVQQADGSLTVKMPTEVAEQFALPVSVRPEPRLGQWRIDDRCLEGTADDSFAWCRLASLPRAARLETTITFSTHTRGCGVILRADETLDAYYQVRLEPGRNRVVFDRWPRPGDEPFMLERPVGLAPSQAVQVRVLVEDSTIVIYVNDEVALTTRGYDHKGGACGLFVSEGSAEFTRTQLTEARV
jgi:beta-fructofuranosidase